LTGDRRHSGRRSIVTPVAEGTDVDGLPAKLVPTIVIAVPLNVPDGGVMEEIPTADGAAGHCMKEKSRAKNAEQSCKPARRT
jgi:hypothetical protein